MRSTWILAAILLATGTGANAAKQYLNVQAEPEQQSRMDSGVEMVESDLPTTSARIFEPEVKVEKRLAIQVMVFNASGEPFNFGPENVTAETAGGEAVAVIPYEKLVKEEKGRRTWAAIGLALGAMGNSLNAANAGYSHGTVNAFGSGGWGTANYSAYNAGQAYAAQSLANTQNQIATARFQENSAASMEALKANLRTTTVDPGETFGGQLMLEMPKAARKSKEPVDVLIHMALGGETHTFHAQLIRRD